MKNTANEFGWLIDFMLIPHHVQSLFPRLKFLRKVIFLMFAYLEVEFYLKYRQRIVAFNI